MFAIMYAIKSGHYEINYSEHVTFIVTDKL